MYKNLNWRLPPVCLKLNDMDIEELKKELSNVFIDFGNGFRFSVEDVIKENHDIYGESIVLKIHPGSIRWIEIEHKLKQDETKSIKKEASI